MELEDYSWEKVEKELWEKTYQSDEGHFLYIKDNYLEGEEQTEISDWNEPRYEVNLKEPLMPEPHEETLKEVDRYDEAELYLDILISELERGVSPGI